MKYDHNLLTGTLYIVGASDKNRNAYSTIFLYSLPYFIKSFTLYSVTAGFQLVCGRPTPSPQLHVVVRFAWKIPRSYVYYLRNIDVKIKTKIKQT